MNHLSRRLFSLRNLPRTFRFLQMPVMRFAAANSKPDPDGSHPDFQPHKKSVQNVKSADQVKAEIDTIVKNNKIVLFMKGVPASPMCGYSNYVVEVLKFYKIKDYYSVDVLRDPQVRELVKEYSNWPTFPQLYVNGKLVGGCDIVTEMHQDGSLKKLFATVGQ